MYLPSYNPLTPLGNLPMEKLTHMWIIITYLFNSFNRYNTVFCKKILASFYNFQVFLNNIFGKRYKRYRDETKPISFLSCLASFSCLAKHKAAAKATATESSEVQISVFWIKMISLYRYTRMYLENNLINKV